MAALGMYDYRDPSLEDFINFEKELLVIQGRGGTKQELKVLQMECTMPSGATMIAADAGRTAEFDGVATPIIVYAISSDNTQDKAAGTGALEVTVFGFDENHDYIEEAFTLNGTTQVTGTNKLERLIGAKLTSCGTDGVGTGNVTITDTGQGNVYLTIPAGQIASAQAGKVYVPAGWNALILDFQVGFIQTANATAALYVEGANVWIKLIDELLTPDELKIFTVEAHQTNAKIKPGIGVVVGANNVLIDVFHQSVDTDVTTHPIRYQIYYLLWKEA